MAQSFATEAQALGCVAPTVADCGANSHTLQRPNTIKQHPSRPTIIFVVLEDSLSHSWIAVLRPAIKLLDRRGT